MKPIIEAHPYVTFVVMFAITSLVPTQLITMDRFVLCILFYFAIFILTIGVLRPANLFACDLTVLIRSLTFFSLAVAIHLTLVGYVLSNLYFEPPPLDPRGTSFLLMNDYFMWAKPFDILAQQGLIFGLHRHLIGRGKTLRQVQVIFLVVFGVPHVFQMMLTEIVVGIGFAVASLTGAIMFPYFLGRHSSGPALCFMFHLMTYTLTALVIWSAFYELVTHYGSSNVAGVHCMNQLRFSCQTSSFRFGNSQSLYTHSAEMNS